jgi:hypothetical protein
MGAVGSSARPRLPALLALPVPAYTGRGVVALEGFWRSMVMADVERDGSWSVTGVQVGLELVPLVVFHTPPFTVAM